MEYGESSCPFQPIVIVDSRQVAAFQDAASYWYGLTTGYVLTLLTVIVIITVLNRLGGRRV